MVAAALITQPAHAQSAPGQNPAQIASTPQAAPLPDAPAVQVADQAADPQAQAVTQNASSKIPSRPPLQFHWDPTYHPNLQPVTVRGLPHNFIQDQMDIWTSPARIRWNDAQWLVPFGISTGWLISTDQHSMTDLVRTPPHAQHQANEVADGGVAVLGGIPLLMFIGSSFTYAPHGRETALLSGEAVADSLVVSEAMQYAFSRERPETDNNQGKFFQNTGYSFPSNHAIAAWSLASVLGQEYPGVWSRLAVYSAASAVSIARVVGEQHFPSDVLVGSAFGYLIGHYVYRARHNDALTSEFRSADPAPHGPGAVPSYLVPYTPGISLQQSAQSIADEPIPAVYKPNPADMDPDGRGSVYVPMDSWIYPALDRIAGFGFIPTQSAGMRPWTRQECLRQITEAEGIISSIMFDRNATRRDLISAREATRMLRDLKDEFAHEDDYFEYLKLDSLYARSTTISGVPLNRSWDFGQTLDNDYGRPYAQGTSTISGGSIAAVSGRFSFYMRDEFQHAPGYANYAQSVLDFINGPQSGGIDEPPPFGLNFSSINRNVPVEMYTGLQLGGWEFQFGKQEIYWGPGYDGPLSWSINAVPTYNAQIVTTRPHQMPWFFAPLGTWRLDLVMGKLSGHTSPARPWYNGQKITLNFGSILEMGFTRWSLFAGVGSPLTIKNFWENIISTSSDFSGKDPGDRKSGFDFRIHVPGARWVTLYADSYADDDPSPLDAPRRSAWTPGIYLARIPFLPRVDFRFEVPSTLLFAGDQGPHFQYSNDHYVDSNMNKNFFFGNSVGRDGRRYEGWTTYWFGARTNIQAGYRQTIRSEQLLPNGTGPSGGTQSDGLLRSTVALGQHFTAGLFVQYERYNEPILTQTMGGPQKDWTGQFQLKWDPKTTAQIAR